MTFLDDDEWTIGAQLEPEPHPQPKRVPEPEPEPGWRSKLVDGDTFLHGDGSDDLVVRWGTQDRVLWASGESLLVVAPTGVGKTTLAVQLVEAAIGLGDGTVLGLPVKPARRVLYFAMDRPRQIRRMLRRRFGTTPVGERLWVHKGPTATDISLAHDQFLTIARAAGADLVVIDSLKDALADPANNASGGEWNRAIQDLNANDIDVLVLHHLKKIPKDTKAAISDLYGSVHITNGAGSIVLLWGEASDDRLELVHLKSPIDPVGPIDLDVNHTTGVITALAGFDPLTYLRTHPGCSVLEAARVEHGPDTKSGSAAYKRTARRFRALVHKGLATTTGQLIKGGEARYHPVTADRDRP